MTITDHHQARHTAAPPSTRTIATPRLAFIDGMRAIAVVSVIAYHVGLPGFGGGFVGVDLFFVISGFLISGQILSGLEARTFRFAAFYARRVLRILPPLFLVLAATLAVGLGGWLLAPEIRGMALSGAAAAGMVSNLYFADTGYFAAPAEAEPFLHTWSLGVEEQFYIVAPLILAFWLALFRRGGRDPFRPMATLIAVSILFGVVASVFLSTSDADLAFFSMPVRAWEFSAGGLLAYAASHGWRLPDRLGQAAGWLGLGLVAAAVSLIGPDTLFPGWVVVIPVLGAVLILASGAASATARILSLPPLVFVGAVSYGWYLWHWPALFFARTWQPGPPSLAVDLAAVVFAFAAAVATHVWLERPLARYRHSDAARRNAGRIVAAGLAASAALVVLFLAVAWLAGRGSAGVATEAMTAAHVNPLADCPSGRERDLADGRPICTDGANGPLAAILWGDSHAANLHTGVAAAAAALGHSEETVWLRGCPGLLGWSVYESGVRRADCDRHNAAMLKLVEDAPGGAAVGVVLTGRWMLYSGRGWPRRTSEVSTLRPADGAAAAPQAYADVLADGLTQSLTRLTVGGRRVVLVAAFPEFQAAGPECLLRFGLDSRRAEKCAMPRADADARRSDFMTAVAQVLPNFPTVRLVDPFALFCDAEFCRSGLDGEVLFRDRDHLNAAGARRMAEAFAADFAWVMGGP